MRRYIVKDPLYRAVGKGLFIRNGFKNVRIDIKFFPDGELYLRFLDPIDPQGHYYVLLGGYPDQNIHIMIGLFIIETLREFGVDSITVLWPYMPYARQDKRFLEGEVISARVIADLMFRLGVSRIYTVDVHSEQPFLAFGDRFVNISSMPLWERFIFGSYIARYGRLKVALLAPDKGRKTFVGTLANRLGINYTYFEKKRDLVKGNILYQEPADYDVYREILDTAQCVIILDDIIATGGTLVNIVSRLRDDGFMGEVVVGATHGLLLGRAVDRLFDAGVSRIVTSDTVENPFSVDVLSWVPLLLTHIL